MDLDLSGRRALITGSARGIGYATALGLAGMGAEVVLHGRDSETLAVAENALMKVLPGAKVRAVAADLSIESGYERIFDAVSGIDVLVNNLGIYQQKDFWEISDDDWSLFLNVNLLSGVRLTRHYLPGMLGRNWGRVVNVSSESGVFIPKEMIHYGVTKAAQLAFSRGAAELTAGTGVTVNSVLPGPTMVETTQRQLRQKAEQRGDALDVVAAETFTIRRPSTLLRRYATPDEVANMICYLCSPAASATNGAPVRVDGGIVKTYV